MKKKLNTSIFIRIPLDTDEFKALESISKFLRTRTASAAVRWALVTAAEVVAQKNEELTGRVALQAALDNSNLNTESTRFSDQSKCLALTEN